MNGATFQRKEMVRLSEIYPEGNIPEWEDKAYHDIQEAMDAMKVIIDYGNVMGRKPEQTAEILVDALSGSHRTLQQNAISSLIQTLVFYADATNDGRNEYSVNTCKKIADFLEEQNLTYKGKYSAPCV